jgi:hypothetical protein
MTQLLFLAPSRHVLGDWVLCKQPSPPDLLSIMDDARYEARLDLVNRAMDE